MADFEMVGSIALYRSADALILPALPHPKIDVLAIRFNWIAGIDFDYSVQGKCPFYLGNAVEPEEVHADEDRVDARCAEAHLRRLGWQQAEHLALYQRQFPILHEPKINRIWFRGIRVTEKDTMGTYYPVLFRQKPSGGRFSKWRTGWAHDFDAHTHNDRIAFTAP